jgi:hypothetical protein
MPLPVITQLLSDRVAQTQGEQAAVAEKGGA